MDEPRQRSARGAGSGALQRGRALLTRLSSGGEGEPSQALVAELTECLESVVAHAERVDSEQADLERQQAALRTVLASVPFFVFWKDRDGIYRGCNDKFAELYGFGSGAEMIGKSDYDLPGPRAQADFYRETDLNVMRTAQPTLNLEETTHDADGNEKVILTSKVPLQAEDGSIIGIIGIFADITSRKQMEKDLERSKELAEAANLAKGDFLAAMSHELRTPLTLILSPLESLLARRHGLSPDASRTLVQVHRNAARLKALTDEILDFSKHQAGHLQLNEEVVSPSEHVRQLASDAEPAATALGIRLDLHGIQAHLGAARLDVAKLDKILTNLIGNALKFTPPGGCVSVSLALVGEELSLSVTDTGIGIDPSQHDRLFRRFEQLDNGSKRRHGGTGLGLSLVKAFAELMGGRVQVESALGHGSTFTVTLPFVPETEATPLRQLKPSPLLVTLPASGTSTELGRAGFSPGGATMARVLVAEDNPELRGYVASLLSPFFEVVTVGDGAEALAVIARDRPDVVVSDVMMPEMDGFELLARLKGDAGLCHIPILLLTARASAESSADSLNLGADDYLAKPFSAIDLVARVRAAYRMKQLNANLLEAERRVAASERLAGLGRLLAKLSHELNNPVNVIYNGVTPLEEYCRALVRYTSACDAAAEARGDRSLAPLRESLDLPFIVADLPEAMRAVRDAALRVMDVQSNLVMFLQGKRALKLVPDELVRLVESTVELGRRSAFGGASTEVISSEMPALSFDAGRLGQALLNLLKNAAEAAGPAGRVRVETACVGDRARISVSDNGPGVPPAIRDRLFEPFFTTKDVGVGTGLGLAVSLEIVSQHGGRLFLDDTYRDGACFVIELPLPGAHDSPEQRAQLPTVVPPRPEVFA